MKVSLDRIDKVLVAGGSSRLPFMKEEIQIVLPTLVNSRDIIIGSDTDEAVAYGIAWECREQVRRDPKLSVGKIAPCVLNDLYLGFRETRRDAFQIPRVKYNGTVLADGQLLSSPFETEETVFKYEVELPFDISEKVLYAFTDKPMRGNEDVDYLNLSHDVFSAPKLGKLSRKCELSLEIKPSGLIRPVFWFRGKGSSARKLGEKVSCPEFYFPGFQVKEGNAYIGLDFGNSNSYLVRFASIPQEITASQYPEFGISRKVKDRLRDLELRIEELRGKGFLSRERLIEHALDEALEIIFHSNKIEGNPLTKGETESVLSQDDRNVLSEKELEAKNLEAAYDWMLANFESCLDQPEAFIREINGLIVKDIKPNGGQYRTEQVSLSGMDFVPPQGTSVPAFMRQLGEEVKTRGPDRSPLEFATSLHTKLVWIHPFIDGNGRTARLLLDACLLAQGLPVVVVNYADRERYLHCLSESNEGDLTSMVEFFIECFEQQIEDFTADRIASTETDDVSNTIEATSGVLPKSATDRIDEVIQEIGVAQEPNVSLPKTETDDAIEQAIKEVAIEESPVVSTKIEIQYARLQAVQPVVTAESDDPLAAIMREKILEQDKIRHAEYDAWRQSFLTIGAELRAIVESFNHQYTDKGYEMRLQEYDVLTFEKYDDISMGKRATRTWFIGFEISRGRSSEKVLLFFNRASWRLTEDPRVSRVSLALSRFDGSRYQRLSIEPISLREIGYRDGELLFFSREGIMRVKEVRHILKLFLSELIRSYL
jgi:Fic family protein